MARVANPYSKGEESDTELPKPNYIFEKLALFMKKGQTTKLILKIKG